MKMLTVFQIMGVSAAYLGVTLVLPWLLLRRKFAALRTPAKFMAYLMAGNFFCMNLVFLLQLFHISNRVTLILGTLIPFFAAAAKRRKSFPAVLERRMGKLRIIVEGEMGVRTLLLRTGNKLGKLSSGWLGQWFAPRWPDVLLSAGIVGLVLYMYGTNTVNVYGYCASDMVLHNYWINYMESNHIFVDGVYPFGFHCIIYYLHVVFSIPTYVLLRVFALTQTLVIHLVLLAFLKLVCKSKYTPYAGVMAYIVSGVFYQYTYFRYYAPLPQEYGMIFILPSVWFAIAFLKEKDFISVAKKKIRAGEGARLSLTLFTVSISMTLAVHFYDTMITGLLCVGIAVGFCCKCLRWRYLKRLVLAGVTGILIAVLPMAAAYASGTPLQGSLHWGMNMLSSGSKEDASGENVSAQEKGSADLQDGGLGDALDNEASAGHVGVLEEHGHVEKGDTEDSVSGAQSSGGKENEDAGKASLSEVLYRKLDCVLGELQYYVTNDSRAAAEFMLGSVGVLFALGLLWYILRRPDYAGVLVALSVFMGLLCVFQASAKLGLPQLLEVSRYSVYIGYGLPIVWSLCLDAVVYLLFQERRGIHMGGMAALAAACVAVALTGFREPVCLSAYETNEAITCVANILKENKGNTSWTICSANDEQQMTWERGYHYEIIEFLRNQAQIKEDTDITIPTDTVYFFIEKVPILYLDYLNTIKPEKKVSLEGAETPLPQMRGILPYIEEERWVTMSHMYYWAQAFRELYPNEMEVYYETDNFVCYRVRQDGFSLYNFAIDYGYNQ